MLWASDQWVPLEPTDTNDNKTQLLVYPSMKTLADFLIYCTNMDAVKCNHGRKALHMTVPDVESWHNKILVLKVFST